MKVNRTEQIYIGYNENLSNLCYLSKNLYNQANYILRQAFIKIINYIEKSSGEMKELNR